MAKSYDELLSLIVEYSRLYDPEPDFVKDYDYSKKSIMALKGSLQNLEMDSLPKMYDAYDANNFAKAKLIAIDILAKCKDAGGLLSNRQRTLTDYKFGSDDTAIFVRSDEASIISDECWRIIFGLRRKAKSCIRDCDRVQKKRLTLPGKSGNHEYAPEEYLVMLTTVRPPMSIFLKLKKVYGLMVPLDICKIVSSGPAFIGTDIRVLSLSDVVDPTQIDPDAGGEFIRRKIVPLFDFGDNDIGGFDLRTKSFCKYNLVDKVVFGRTKNIKDWIK